MFYKLSVWRIIVAPNGYHWKALDLQNSEIPIAKLFFIPTFSVTYVPKLKKILMADFLKEFPKPP